MKRTRIDLIIALFSVLMMVFVTSCKKDDTKPVDTGSNKPVLDEDFSYTVTGNTVNFTTTLTASSVWFTNETTGSDHTVKDGSVTVKIPKKGDYNFTCNELINGSPVSSDTFVISILQDDIGYLNQGLWLYLSGGANQTKTWRMDMNVDGKCVYFDGPVYYSGADGNPYWAWDVLPEDLPVTVDGTEMTSIFNWSPSYADNGWIMAPKDYGTITIDATNMTITTNRFGETCESGFEFDTVTRMFTIKGDCKIPIDTARMNEGPLGEFPDMQHLKIFTLSDSAMQIGIKREYEGLNDDGSQKQSEWVMVYNFVVADYTYTPKEEFTYTEPVMTSFTANDLVGTWTVAPEVAQDWIGWIATGDQGTTHESMRLNPWTTRDAMVTDLKGWSIASVDSIMTAADAKEYVFNGDGTCTLAGVNNTYTVTDGIITFGTELTNEFSMASFSFTGTDVTVLDVSNDNDGNPYTYDGIWIGQKNGEKNESSAIHLVKKVK